MKPVSFQFIAPYYDLLARFVFGDALDKAQTAFFSLIPQASSILIMGGGSGRILDELIDKVSPRQIFYVETSSAMLRLAKKRLSIIQKKKQMNTEVQFIHGNEDDIPQTLRCDVLMTFFLLDVYATPQAKVLTYKLSHHLRPSGSWLFADFCLEGKGIQLLWKKALLNIMYKFFWLTTNLHNQSLPDYQLIFEELQYFPVQQKYFYRGFIVSIIYRKLLA